jgi:acyl-coenzyme A synthetase/AMP-(fatty) acid ligase
VNELVARADEVWNMYGPTETTIWSTTERLTAGDGPVLIGRPIANTQVYVLDAHRQPVPAGVPGELYIGGAGVARGYLGRPELTAERFVPHPFAGEVGAPSNARLYRTGDLVRFTRSATAPGALEFLGRVDFQVKVRGFRIELGEIESALLAHEAVKQAVVTVREDRLGDKRLVAYVVFHPGESATQSELRRPLRKTLPDYMVPSLIQEMDALPLTQNGKVDRKALPDPFARAGDAGEEFAEPTTPMQQFIAGIWREVLGVPRVGKRDNFFDLGGHSLLSMRVMSRMEQKFGRRLNPRAMVLQTLEQIASEAETLVAQ